ncbi:MAG TPA: hypothetical protein DEB31_02850, partial [Clostridiales bacterium]|nr:hypothetical protein [Clostridiales bacterium]
MTKAGMRRARERKAKLSILSFILALVLIITLVPGVLAQEELPPTEPPAATEPVPTEQPSAAPTEQPSAAP